MHSSGNASRTSGAGVFDAIDLLLHTEQAAPVMRIESGQDQTQLGRQRPGGVGKGMIERSQGRRLPLRVKSIAISMIGSQFLPIANAIHQEV